MKGHRLTPGHFAAALLGGLLLGASPIVSAADGQIGDDVTGREIVKRPFKAANPTYRPGRATETAEFAQMDEAAAPAPQLREAQDSALPTTSH